MTGVGPGTGAAMARRFARGGDAVAMLARNQERLASLEREIVITPGAIAEEVWHVAHQERCAWSFNVEVRPFGETW